MLWISCVPATINKAKELLTSNLKQKWILLLSQKMKEKKEETFRKKLENSLKKQKCLIISRKEEIFFKEYVLKATEERVQDLPSVMFET